MKLDMAGVSVMLAMPVHRDLPVQTVRSLLETQGVMQENNIPLVLHLEVGGSLVHHARTVIAHHFLKGECNRLFWIDSDIAWSGQDFLRFIALSTKMEVVCGSYPCKSDPPLFFLNLDDADAQLEANEYGCLPVKGAGLGFTIVQRQVMERLAEKAPKLIYPRINEPIPRIFRCDELNGEARGEDMAFFADVRELGYRVNLDPSITLGHVGSKEYSASIGDFITKV